MKKENWEKEFDEKFDKLGELYAYPTMIKSFIRNLLKEEKKKWRDKTIQEIDNYWLKKYGCINMAFRDIERIIYKTYFK